MNKAKYYIGCPLIVLFFLILNGAVFYLSACTGEYIRTSDANGIEHIEKRSVIAASDRILSEGCTAEELLAECERLYAYRTALLYLGNNSSAVPEVLRYSSGQDAGEWAKETSGMYSLTYGEAETRTEQLRYCIGRLEYVSDYPRYVSGVLENSRKLSEISLIGTDSYAGRNIIRTGQDFYGLDKISISPESDIGVITLFADTVTDISAAAAALLTALLFGAALKESDGYYRSGRLLAGGLVTLLVGTALMYISNAIMTERSVGLGSLSRSVQSVQTFVSCSRIMNVGTLIALRILFKLIICAAVYFLAAGLIVSKRRLAYSAAAAVFIIAEAVLYINGSGVSVFGAFSAERIIAVYGNINIFGNAVDRTAVFVPAVLIMLAAAVIFSQRSCAAYVLCKTEKAEKEHYDGIMREQEEIRRIKHDIGNHLSAVSVLIDDGKISEAREYLREISSEIYSVQLPVSTGRPVPDALLYNKLTAARSMGISVKTEISAVPCERISDYDLCGLFGNILDNAIEGCMKADGEKTIALTVRRQHDMLCIFCENSCDDIPDSELSTTKPDKKLHGFGLKRIRQIAGRYGGRVEISAENGVFAVSVLL